MNNWYSRVSITSGYLNTYL